MNYGATKSDEAVTILVTRHPRKSDRHEFERALSSTIDATLKFPGHLGVTVLKPDSESDNYQIIVKFASKTDYQRWLRSPEATYWLNILNRFENTPPNMETMTGLEAWFATTTTSRPIIPPPRYKMAVVTWLAIFVLIVVINLLFGSWLATLPMLLRSLILTVVLVSSMTYIVMPRMTRLFSGWLYQK